MEESRKDVSKREGFTSSLPFKWKMMIPLLIVMLLVLAYPLFYSIWISFRNLEVIKPNQDEFVAFAQYVKMFNESLFCISIKNTFLFLLIAVSLEFVLGLMLAISLKKHKMFSNITRSVLLTPMLVTPVAVGLMFRFLLNSQLGLIPKLLGYFGINISFFGKGSALVSLALIDVWQWTPFMVIMLLAGLESLPREPYEAAQVEGANSWDTLTKITIPLLKPV